MQWGAAIQVHHRRFWGLGWASGGKLAGENYGFDVGESKLFNNSTTFQP